MTLIQAPGVPPEMLLGADGFMRLASTGRPVVGLLGECAAAVNDFHLATELFRPARV